MPGMPAPEPTPPTLAEMFQLQADTEGISPERARQIVDRLEAAITTARAATQAAQAIDQAARASATLAAIHAQTTYPGYLR